SDIKHRPSTPSSITSPSLHDALPIYDGGADLHRAGARLAVHMAGNAHQTAHRLEDRIIAGARRVRPGLAEAGHRTIDDAGIDGADLFVVEAVALEIADLVVLHEDVAGFGELADDRLAFGLGDVDGDRLLVAVGAKIERVVVVLPAIGIDQVRRAKGARIVAGARPFDLDHLGAEIRKHLRRQGPRQHARQIKDFDA